jgi:serine/threonine protein kinase
MWFRAPPEAAVSCPNREELIAFDQGSLSTDALETIANHLDTCDSCSEYLSSLGPSGANPKSPPLRLAADRLLQEAGYAELRARALFILKEESTPKGRSPSPEDGAALSLPAVFGSYELLERLGQGGMGVVYRARQPSLDRQVAIKVIRAGAHASESELARFRAEAHKLACLHHPHIVAVHEAGEEHNCPYFVMELMEGGSLARQMARAQQTPRRAAALVHTLAQAVHHAHVHGIIHRDIKPAKTLKPVQSGHGVSHG